MKNIKLKNEKEIYIMEENYDVVTTNNEEVEVTESGSSMSGTTGAILGSLLTIAAIAGVSKIKKIVKDRKLKKETEFVDDDEAFDDEDVIDLKDVTDLK